MVTIKNMEVMKRLKIIITILIITAMNTINAQSDLKDLFFSKQVEGSYDEVFQKIEASLKANSFGIVTDLKMHDKFKEKLDVTINTYEILGICNPKLAYEAIQVEENIGVFLPCTLILKKKGDKLYEVVTFNPVIMMGVLNNPELDKIALQVTQSLKSIIEGI